MRSFFFFFFWFVWIGGANIVPQVYLLAVAPEHKEQWIALLLAIGSVMSMAGVWLAARPPRLLERILFHESSSAALWLITIGSFAVLFLHPPLTFYFISYAVFRFVSCFLYQSLDQYLVRKSEPTKVLQHNRNAMLLMFLAITVSPLFFAYATSPLIILGVVGSMAGFAAYWLRDIGQTSLSTGDAPPTLPVLLRRTPLHDYFIVYCGAYLAIIFLTSSLLVYFVRDYYALPKPVHSAGWIMLVTSACASVSCLSFAFTVKDASRALFSPILQYWVVGLQIVAITLLFLKLSISLWYLCLCTSMMGIAYGIFMVTTRHFAADTESGSGRGLLSVYNMLPYICTFIVFSLAGLLNYFSAFTGFDFHRAIAGLIVLLFVIIVLAYKGVTAQWSPKDAVSD